MKQVIFIGSRLNALDVMPEFSNLKIVKAYIEDGSLLHQRYREVPALKGVDVRIFKARDKQEVIADISATDFDLLVSNGCPIILPVAKMPPSKLYLNVHPTLLPDLKGRTPLNGVFLTHRKYIGATMHYIDPGVDTGRIIAQAKVKLTPDIDQGLVYKISFDLERDAFRLGMEKLIASDFSYAGRKQVGPGSYLNRTPELQQLSAADGTQAMMDTIRSFGIKGQGSYLTLARARYCVYAAEPITNPYLLETYAGAEVGTIAFEYDDKLVLRTSDGLIKLTDFERQE